MMGAVMVGQKLGYKTFVLIGGLGGDRFDHSQLNLDVLLYTPSTAAARCCVRKTPKCSLCAAGVLC